MAKEEFRQTIGRYLQDAIAAESNFESQLKDFAGEASDPSVRAIFAEHAGETRRQAERLTASLSRIGEEPSGVKSFLAHMFGMAPKTAQVGHEPIEKTTQNLIIACAAESSEVAMYEALAIVASAAGDPETETLARQIQQEERRAWDKVRNALPAVARTAVLSAGAGDKGQELVRAYLEDCIAAERNFESLLASFSKMGSQDQVQQLFSTLSARAKTQHERLASRLELLGGSPSTAKSILAHFLGFAPGLLQATQAPEEKNTQNLIMTCAAAGAEMGMYEALAAAAMSVGDGATERLARDLQQEEAADFEMTWALLPNSALGAFRSVTGTRRDAA